MPDTALLQKKFLVLQLDKAIEKHVDDNEKKFVKFAIPNGIKYNIPSTLFHLKKFKKNLIKMSTWLYIYPKTNIKSNIRKYRYDLNNVEFYREHKQRKTGLIKRKLINCYSDGFFMNVHYAVKSKKPDFYVIENDDAIHNVIPDDTSIKAKILGEYNIGKNFPTLAHIVDEYKADIYVDINYVDSIMTLYPDAKPYMSKYNRNLVTFKVGSDIVGIIACCNNVPSPNHLIEEIAKFNLNIKENLS